MYQISRTRKLQNCKQASEVNQGNPLGKLHTMPAPLGISIFHVDIDFQIPFLCAFAKSQKATVRFVISVCLSVCLSVRTCPRQSVRNNSAAKGRIFITSYLSISRKSVEKIQVSLNLTRIMGTLHEHLYTFMIIPRWILLRMRNVSSKLLKKIETYILCRITFFRKSCRLWDNMEKYGIAGQATDDNITRRMRFARWITKTTDTHS
jgi:hypothetical protein